MKDYTVYDFAKKLMSDDEFNRGGIMKNERKYMDSIGFEYIVKDGQVDTYGDDLRDFFNAMCVLCKLNNKYEKGKSHG